MYRSPFLNSKGIGYRKIGPPPMLEYIHVPGNYRERGVTYIYALINYTGQVFYIGVTYGPAYRLKQHCDTYRASGFEVREDAPWKTLEEYWFDVHEGTETPLLVEMRILEMWPDREIALERERHIIKSYRARGVKLRNDHHNRVE